MTERLIVIGGTAAGLSAASKAKRNDPAIDVKVFEKSGYISYGACGLPYFVGGTVPEADALISMTPEQMEKKRGIVTFRRHEVCKIDRERKRVLVHCLENGDKTWHTYDKLVIATGAEPVVPDIPGIKSKGVYFLRTVENGIELRKAAMQAGKRAVVVGGGFIGLEMAQELTRRGLEVHLVEAAPCLLPAFPKAYSRLVMDTLTENGVKLYTNEKIEEICTKDDTVTGIRINQGVLPADFVLICVGVCPVSGLAADCGLKLGANNSIAVNDYMQTSDPSIWACGDCAETKHRLLKEPVYIPLGTTANKQGKLAGNNLSGGQECFQGVLGSMVTKCFDCYIAQTGLTPEKAKAEGYEVEDVCIEKSDRASYYPGGKTTYLRLIFERSEGRLLGAQGMGGESIAGRINVLAAVITAGMSVSELAGLDLVYAPPVAPVYDPILIAAMQAEKKIGRKRGSCEYL